MRLGGKIQTMELIEFKNKQGDILRGVLNKSNGDQIVVFLHGFERTSITERKFRVLSDEFLKENISSFGFDFTGGGSEFGSSTDIAAFQGEIFLHSIPIFLLLNVFFTGALLLLSELWKFFKIQIING